MKKIDTLYKEWQELQPLPERKRYLLNQRFTVEYNFNSNHIEGNTLTYGQTELLLLFGKVSGEGNLKDFVGTAKQYVKPFLAGVVLTFAAQSIYNNNEKAELKQAIQFVLRKRKRDVYINLMGCNKP